MGKRPQQTKFKRRILTALSESGDGLTGSELREFIRSIYAQSPEPQFQARFNEATENLTSAGLIRSKDTGLIALTTSGREDLKAVDAKRGERLARKRHKAQQERQAEVLRESKLAVDYPHKLLQLELFDLGEKLGLKCESESRLVPGVILDVAWYLPGTAASARQLTHAFEVQHLGDWKNAIGNLETARRLFARCRLFLVVVERKERIAIDKRLGETQNSAITMISPQDIRQLLPMVKTPPKKMTAILKLMQKMAL